MLCQDIHAVSWRSMQFMDVHVVWTSLMCHDHWHSCNSRTLMLCHGCSCCVLDTHGVLDILAVYRSSCHVMDIHFVHGHSGLVMVVHVASWIVMLCCGLSWCAMTIHAVHGRSYCHGYSCCVIFVHVVSWLVMPSWLFMLCCGCPCCVIHMSVLCQPFYVMDVFAVMANHALLLCHALHTIFDIHLLLLCNKLVLCHAHPCCVMAIMHCWCHGTSCCAMYVHAESWVFMLCHAVP